MIKKDGHTHTEFCPHGSGDDVELMIQKAIKLGFKEYSVTEHAPLPPQFKNDYAGELTGLTEASMNLNDIPAYFDKIDLMKQRYGKYIKINVGFEVDFLPQYTNWTKSFLTSFKQKIDESVLSVHFLKGQNDKFWCVDDTIKDFQRGLLASVRNPQELYRRYFEQVQLSVETDLGPNTPIRIGHLNLIKKFQDAFDLPNQFNEQTNQIIQNILESIAHQNRQLDFNMAGLFKKHCNEPYLDKETLQKAHRLGIPLVYGSDAHSIEEVGHAYHLFNYF